MLYLRSMVGNDHQTYKIPCHALARLPTLTRSTILEQTNEWAKRTDASRHCENFGTAVEPNRS